MECRKIPGIKMYVCVCLQFIHTNASCMSSCGLKSFSRMWFLFLWNEILQTEPGGIRQQKY